MGEVALNILQALIVMLAIGVVWTLLTQCALRAIDAYFRRRRVQMRLQFRRWHRAVTAARERDDLDEAARLVAMSFDEVQRTNWHGPQT